MTEHSKAHLGMELAIFVYIALCNFKNISMITFKGYDGLASEALHEVYAHQMVAGG